MESNESPLNKSPLPQSQTPLVNPSGDHTETPESAKKAEASGNNTPLKAQPEQDKGVTPGTPAKATTTQDPIAQALQPAHQQGQNQQPTGLPDIQDLVPLIPREPPKEQPQHPSNSEISQLSLEIKNLQKLIID